MPNLLRLALIVIAIITPAGLAYIFWRISRNRAGVRYDIDILGLVATSWIATQAVRFVEWITHNRHH